MSNSLQLKDQFDHVCRLVAHEDNLVNIRTTWALVFHGFLFAAFVGGVGLYEKLKFESSSFNPITVGILVACSLGVTSAIAAYFGVRAAENQLRNITTWWGNILKDSDDVSYPEIYMHSGTKSDTKSDSQSSWTEKVGASVYFLMLAISWAVLAGIVICSSEPRVIT